MDRHRPRLRRPIMATVTTHRATVDDLLRTEGKAELIGGKIVQPIPPGPAPSIVAGRIYRRLADHVDHLAVGFASMEGMGFRVTELPSGREPFSPDTSYYDGPAP